MVIEKKKEIELKELKWQGSKFAAENRDHGIWHNEV